MPSLLESVLFAAAFAAVPPSSAGAACPPWLVQDTSAPAAPPCIRFCYTESRAGRSQVMVRSLDGDDAQAFTNGGSDLGPSASPDGSMLAFHSHRSGGWKVWLQDAPGQPARRLTRTSAAGFNYEYFPAWSPDGEFLAMEKWNDAERNFEIHLVARDGSDERNLTDSPGHDRLPSWSPDGRWLLFGSRRDGNDEIYRMAPDGSAVLNLTQYPATDYAASCSPDGKRILFHSDRDGAFGTYLMSVSGEGVAPVPGIDAEDHLQGWSPTGSNSKSIPYTAVRSVAGVWGDQDRILFTSVRGGDKDVVLLDVRTGERRVVAGGEGDQWLPAVLPARSAGEQQGPRPEGPRR